LAGTTGIYRTPHRSTAAGIVMENRRYRAFEASSRCSPSELWRQARRSAICRSSG
jgi:hypothetical protein